MTNSETLGLSELASKANESRRIERGKMHAMRALIDALKYPVWLKDEDGRMIIINKAYTDKFGIEAKDYEGRFDADIWPQEVADQYKQNDSEALAKNGHLEAFETVPTTKGAELLYIIKTALEIDGKKYVKGEALKVDDLRLIVRICDG